MFQQRQLTDIYGDMEVSFATVTPGTVGANSGVFLIVTPVIGGAGTGNTTMATVLPGDIIDAVPPASAGSLAGLLINVSVVAAGSYSVNFYNTTGSPITPTSAIWTFVAKRLRPDLI
jgi:hypothetical protein